MFSLVYYPVFPKHTRNTQNDIHAEQVHSHLGCGRRFVYLGLDADYLCPHRGAKLSNAGLRDKYSGVACSESDIVREVRPSLASNFTAALRAERFSASTTRNTSRWPGVARCRHRATQDGIRAATP